MLGLDPACISIIFSITISRSDLEDFKLFSFIKGANRGVFQGIAFRQMTKLFNHYFDDTTRLPGMLRCCGGETHLLFIPVNMIRDQAN